MVTAHRPRWYQIINILNGDAVAISKHEQMYRCTGWTCNIELQFWIDSLLLVVSIWPWYVSLQQTFLGLRTRFQALATKAPVCQAPAHVAVMLPHLLELMHRRAAHIVFWDK